MHVHIESESLLESSTLPLNYVSLFQKQRPSGLEAIQKFMSQILEQDEIAT